jgi:hypothetical protein
MKPFLYFLFVFSGYFLFAQNTELKAENNVKQDTVSQNKSPENMTAKINKDTSSESKSERSKTAQNINIVQEINTVLNYKINRI